MSNETDVGYYIDDPIVKTFQTTIFKLCQLKEPFKSCYSFYQFKQLYFTSMINSKKRICVQT